MMEEECVRKKEMEFQVQFKEAIQAVSAALNTGYSVENAFREAQKELKLIYPETARISKELLFIIRQLRIHVPMEQILEELGMRVQIEDVRNFVTVFAAAKKNGGNMIAIIQDTVRQIGDKIDVKREIDTILAAKRYEFRVMSAIPYAIIGYMSFSFPEFMDSLYGNIFGIGVMTVCLGIYMGAYYLGVRMIRIEV
jgi:Flp pilus assembly protein TadB